MKFMLKLTMEYWYIVLSVSVLFFFIRKNYLKI